jgi:hypothetical protein
LRIGADVKIFRRGQSIAMCLFFNGIAIFRDRASCFALENRSKLFVKFQKNLFVERLWNRVLRDARCVTEKLFFHHAISLFRVPHTHDATAR